MNTWKLAIIEISKFRSKKQPFFGVEWPAFFGRTSGRGKLYEACSNISNSIL